MCICDVLCGLNVLQIVCAFTSEYKNYDHCCDVTNCDCGGDWNDYSQCYLCHKHWMWQPCCYCYQLFSGEITKFGIWVAYTDACQACRQHIIMDYLGLEEWNEDYDDIWDELRDVNHGNDNDNDNNPTNNENNNNNGSNNNGNNSNNGNNNNANDNSNGNNNNGNNDNN